MLLHPMPLIDQVRRARAGDLTAFRMLVEETEGMVYAVSRQVLDDPVEAQDAAQESYLRAFRRLHELEEEAAFPGWLRRIAIGVALNLRRRRRATLLAEEPSAPPVLDEAESAWSETQRARLARALLALSPEERRLCDRRYHGDWSLPRLAEDAGITEAALRKRLQRIRDKLREEIEMDEHDHIRDEHPQALPERIAELLARPRLSDLPENPVGAMQETLAALLTDYTPLELPEIVDLEAARAAIGGDPVYVGADSIHRIDERRILRYDLSLPALLTARWRGLPLKHLCSGKVYRRERVSATHLEAFHQAEIFVVDERQRLDEWAFSGLVLRTVDALLPGRDVQISRVEYPMCAQAWSLDVKHDDRWIELMAWGSYAPWVLRHLGADPERHIAMGAGYGLERIACLRYGIDDIRKVGASRVES
jgi:RNA polymerase sigma-70 factor (ECF subfamily)